MSILVLEWGRGFESHFWHKLFQKCLNHNSFFSFEMKCLCIRSPGESKKTFCFRNCSHLSLFEYILQIFSLQPQSSKGFSQSIRTILEKQNTIVSEKIRCCPTWWQIAQQSKIMCPSIYLLHFFYWRSLYGHHGREKSQKSLEKKPRTLGSWNVLSKYLEI